MTDRKTKYLILTSSGGGGHLQAAKAKYFELAESEHPFIVQKDVFRDFLGPALGGFFAGTWNFCQKHGKITSLYLFSHCSQYVYGVLSPILGINFFYQLIKHDIDSVIDTQHEGTKAFIRAIRLVSRVKKKEIKYTKVLTDLPTKKCIHFFKPFKSLSEKDKKYLKVQTTKPILEKKETEEDFWKKVAGLSLDNIVYSNFPLRHTYATYKKVDGPLHSSFNTYSPEHTHAICRCLSFGDMEYTRRKNSVDFTFTDETLSLITLGSYPQKSVLVDYMLKFIKQKNRYCKDRKDILFLLVGPQKTSLEYYKSIITEIENHKRYPKTLTVVPLAFQTDEALAPLYFNLDFIIAKSGGLTTMELLKAVEGKIFIHDNKVPNFSKFFTMITKHKHDAMLPWERGNANYIIASKKAQTITPELFSKATKSFFKTSSLEAEVKTRSSPHS